MELPRVAATGGDRGSLRRWIFLLAAVGLLAVTLRVFHLGADPPQRMSWSRAPVTDGARVVEAARNRALYGTWFADPQNPAFAHYPLSNLLAYVVFARAGVGLAQAAVPSVVAGVLSWFLFTTLLFRRAGPVAALSGSLLLATNYHLIMFDRLPMSEALMTCLMVAVVSLLVEGVSDRRSPSSERGPDTPSARRPSPFWLGAAGALLGVSAFFVKLNALLLLPLGILLIRYSRTWRGSGPEGATQGKGSPAPPVGLGLFLFIAGIAGMALVWVITIVRFNPEEMARFFDSNILSHYEYDVGDSGGLVEVLQTWFRNRTQGLFFFGVSSMFLSRNAVAAAVALLVLAAYLLRLPRSLKTSDPLVSALVLWLGGGILAMSLFDYRPLRYHIMLIPPICGLAAIGLDRLRHADTPWRPPPLRGRMIPLVAAAGFFLGCQIAGEGGRLLFWHADKIQRFLASLGLRGESFLNAVMPLTQGFARQTFIAASIGVLVVAIYAWFAVRARRRGGVSISGGRRGGIATFLLLAALAGNLGPFLAWANRPAYSLKEAGQDLGEVVGPGALILGNGATVLCLENRHPTVPHFAELIRRQGSEGLTSYPVTHLLFHGNRLRPHMEKNFPEVLESAGFVSWYELAGVTAELWRVPDWPGPTRAETYQPSDFEQGMTMFQQHRFEEAVRDFARFLLSHPKNGSAYVMLGICHVACGQSDQALTSFETAARLRPRDASVQERLGYLRLSRGETAEAEDAWARSLELNPDNPELRSQLREMRSLAP